MTITAQNLKLRKYLKKTGDDISEDDHDVLDVLERAFGLTSYFLVMVSPYSKKIEVYVSMMYKGVEVSFSGEDDEYTPTAGYIAESLRMCAHQLVVMFGYGCRLEVKDGTIEIPSFESATELKMKLALTGKIF